ncbi:MAG: hypothetical protein ACKO4U_05150 [Caldilinea sp.]
MSKDSDFYQQSLAIGFPPKVIWVRWEIVRLRSPPSQRAARPGPSRSSVTHKWRGHT